MTTVSTDGTRSIVEVADAPDAEQAVLRAALSTGPVREFARHRPSLTELYRHVVSENAAGGAPVPGATASVAVPAA